MFIVHVGGRQERDLGTRLFLTRFCALQGGHTRTRQKMFSHLFLYLGLSLVAEMMLSLHFLKQRNLENYLLIVYITFFPQFIFHKIQYFLQES